MTLPHYNQQLNYSYKQSLTPADIQRIASDLGKSKASGNGFMCCCPAHNDNNPSLSISLGMNGKLLLSCFAGCEFIDILHAIQERGLLPYNLTENRESSRKTSVELVRSPVMPCKEEPLTLQQSNNVNEQSADSDFKEKQKRALKIWNESQEIAGTSAELYLQKRGIDTSLPGNHKDTIKYHPNCGDDSNQQWHGLIAQATDKNGNFLGTHRIFLTSAGDKMPITNPKRSLGSVKGGGIRLSSSQQVEDKVILTEGLEDALILAQCCPEYPVIAFLGGNTAIELPESIQEVIIAADADLSGQKQARRIKKRLQEEGLAVGICLPPEKKDFNEFFLRSRDHSLIHSLIENTPLEVSGRISKKTEAHLAFKYQAQEPIFLVENLLPLGGVCLLAGHPKVGKSWMILNIVLSIIQNGKVFEYFLTKNVGVYLLSLEDNSQRLKSRYLKVSGGENPPKGLYLKTLSLPLDKGGIEELKRELEASPEIKLLIIDPFEKVRPQPKSSLNAYQNDYQAIGLIKELAEELEITIFLVHHLRKGDTGNAIADINGSMGLTGAVDTILALYKNEDTEKFTLKVTGKDVEEQELSLEFDADTGLYSISQEIHNKNNNLQNQILEFLNRSQRAHSPKEIGEALGKSTNSDKTMVRQQLQSLLKKGKVRQAKQGLYEIAHKQPVKLNTELCDNITANLTGSTQENTKDFENNCKVVTPDSCSSLNLENTIEIII